MLFNYCNEKIDWISEQSSMMTSMLLNLTSQRLNVLMTLEEVISEYKRIMDFTLGKNAYKIDKIEKLHKLGYLPSYDIN